jgi:iron complex outermembrane receptor protein
LDPGKIFQVDAIARYVDVIAATHIPSYLESDLRISWKPMPKVELAVVGQNLVERRHLKATTSPLKIECNPVEQGLTQSSR